MAGNSQLIDEVVDPVVKKQVSDLEDQLAALDKRLIDTAKSAIVLNTATGNSKSFSDYNKTVQASAIAQQKLQQELNKTAQTAANLTKAQNSLEQQTARQVAQSERAAVAAQKALSPYQQLSKELDNLRAKAKDAGATFGTNSQQFKDASKPVQELDEKLKGIDQTLGQSQRNVGNYKNAISEVLSTYIPFGAGTIRVKENLGSLAEKFGETETGLGSLKKGFAAFGIGAFALAISAAISYLSQFRGASSKIQEGLSILKAQFNELGAVVTGDKSIKDASLGDAAKRGIQIEALKQEAEYNEKITETQNAQTRAQANGFRVLAADRNIDIKQREAYIKQAEGLEKQALERQKDNADEQVKLALDVAEKTNKMNPVTRRRLETGDGDISGANYLANTGKITEEAFELYKKGLEKRAQYTEDYNNHVTALQVDADNMQLRADRGLAQAQLKLDRDKLQGQLDAAKLIMDDENATFDQRLKASAVFVQKSKQLAKLQLGDDLEAANIGGRGGADARTTAKVKEDAYVEYQNTINKITAEGLTQRQSIQKTESEKLKQNLTDLENFQKAQVENNIGDAKDASDQLLQIMQDQFEKEAQLVNKKYADGKLSQKQAQDDYLKLEDQYNIDRLGQEVFLQQQILEVRQAAENRDVTFAQGNGASSAQISEIKSKSGVAQQKNVVAKAGSELNKAVGKQDVDNTKSGIDDQKEALQEFNAFAGESSKAIDIAQQLEDNHYKAQLELLEQKKQLIQDTAKEEIDAINTSIQSSADKQRKINLINSQAAQQQQQLLAQENNIKQKQAIADKEASVAKIIEGTAVAVVNALSIPVFGEALAVVIGALGAAQLAVAIAAPIPKYAKGTGNHPGGAFIWGEKGSEMAIEPSGKTYMSPDHASLGMAPAGTKIIPNHMIRPDKLSYAGGQQVPWKEVIAAINRSKPEPQKRPNVKVTVNNDSYYQKFYK